MLIRSIAWLGCLSSTFLLTGCASWRTLDPPVAGAVADHEGQRLRIKPKSRGAFVYVGAHVEADSIVGDTEALERYAIAIEDVDYVQVRGSDNVGTGFVMFGAVAAVVLIVYAFAKGAALAEGYNSL